MAFIRLKRVGAERYAYLVDNEWTPKGPRQRVKRYLGKYVELSSKPQEPLNTGVPATPGLLITAELRGQGFSERLKHPDLGVKVDLRLCTVKAGTKNVVLGLNGGFLCSFTLRKLLHFIPTHEAVAGYSLARAFSDAGVRVSREQFVAIYRKVQQRAAEH